MLIVDIMSSHTRSFYQNGTVHYDASPYFMRHDPMLPDIEAEDENMASVILFLKSKWKSVISPTLVATLILLSTIWLFGLENSMIAPFATISYLRVINMKNHYGCMVQHFIRYAVTALAAYLAVMNLALCIAVNILAIFWITFIVIDEYHPENHLPVGMSLIFFQIAAIHNPIALGKRMGALALAFVIIFAFVMIITLQDRKKDKFEELIKKGFELSQELIAACPGNDRSQISKLHLQIRAINRELSEEIYAYHRATWKKKGKISFYCRFVVLFQVINYLTKYRNEEGNVERAAGMLEDYKKLFYEYEPEPYYRMLNLRSDRLNIKDFQFRYAVRVMAAMTPCMVFAYLTDIPNAYWLAFSLFYMITPSSDDTMSMVNKRLGGTLIGILISLGLFALFPGLLARIIITVVLNLFIYSARGYILSVAYITCATLAMQTADLGNVSSMIRCVVFTLIGAAIALLVNRFVLRVHTSVQIDLILGYLKNIRETLKKLVQPGRIEEGEAEKIRKEFLLKSDWQEDEHQRRQLADQLCIRSYLMTRRLEELDESSPEEKRRVDFLELEKEHMNYMASFLVQMLERAKSNITA